MLVSRNSGKSVSAILLVEHVMELVMGVTDRIAVLNFGQKIAEDTPAQIQKNKRIVEIIKGAVNLLSLSYNPGAINIHI